MRKKKFLFNFFVFILGLITLGSFVLGILPILGPNLISNQFINEELFSNLNSFGDYIGGTTGALWGLTGASLVGLTFTFQLKQFNEQSNELIQSNFSNTFFNIIDRQYNILNSIVGKENTSGVQAIDYFYKKLKSDFNNRKEEEDLSIVLDKFFNEYSIKIEHYCNSYLNIFQLINGQKAVINKKDYFSLIETQLSQSEKMILFYRLLSLKFEDPEKYKNSGYCKMISEFNLFDNLISLKMLDKAHDKKDLV